MYRVLLTFDVKEGIRNALAHIGIQGMVWTPEAKPAFDAFAELQPNLYIGTTNTWSKGVRKCLEANPSIKSVILGNPAEKGDWENLGITPQIAPTAIDDVLFRKVDSDPALRCDVAYYNMVPGLSDNLIVPLCYPVGKYNIRIYGHRVSLCPQWCGFLPENRKSALFNSCKVVIAGKDDIELVHQVNGAGAFVITQGFQFDTVQELEVLLYDLPNLRDKTMKFPVLETRTYQDIVKEWLEA